jgi:RNA polymerase sigma-B factor
MTGEGRSAAASTVASVSSGDRTDQQLLARWRAAPPGSAERDQIGEVLVRRYEFLVRACVRRYRNSPVPAEDLMQVGYTGLMKAINGFDPEYGTSLVAYAEPCISGELKRYFRDKRWQLHVRRATQEQHLKVRAARAELAQRLSRQPSADELAADAGLSLAELAEAERAGRAFEAASLEMPRADGLTLADTLGAEDPRLDFVLNMAAVWAHWAELSEREQRLLLLRFYGELTQSEIGQRLGMSQMQVSRMLSRALDFLRDRLLAGPDERRTAAGRPAGTRPPPPRGRSSAAAERLGACSPPGCGPVTVDPHPVR